MPLGEGLEEFESGEVFKGKDPGDLQGSSESMSAELLRVVPPTDLGLLHMNDHGGSLVA